MKPAAAVLLALLCSTAFRGAAGGRGSVKRSPARKASTSAIFPGFGLGDVRLGQTHAEVLRRWGRPYMSKRHGTYLMEYWHLGKSEDFMECFFRNGRMVQIDTDSSAFSTPQGISLRSSLGQIRRKYRAMALVPFGEEDYEDGPNYYYDAVREGIAFELGGGGDFSNEDTPLTISVHRRGHRVLPDF